jgi:hypothetical protein
MAGKCWYTNDNRKNQPGSEKVFTEIGSHLAFCLHLAPGYYLQILKNGTFDPHILMLARLYFLQNLYAETEEVNLLSLL